MYLLFLIAFLASRSFYREAVARSVNPGRIASVPLVYAGLFSALSVLGKYVIAAMVIARTKVAGGGDWEHSLFQVFLYLGFFLILRKQWRLLEGVPRTEDGVFELPEEPAPVGPMESVSFLACPNEFRGSKIR
ncbi:MAG: hypothetical protein R3B96_01070 [Pirellulaceae bacterium]